MRSKRGRIKLGGDAQALTQVRQKLREENVVLFIRTADGNPFWEFCPEADKTCEQEVVEATSVDSMEDDIAPCMTQIQTAASEWTEAHFVYVTTGFRNYPGYLAAVAAAMAGSAGASGLG